MISPLSRGHKGRAHTSSSSNTTLDGNRGRGSGGGDCGAGATEGAVVEGVGETGGAAAKAVLGPPAAGDPGLELTAGGGEVRLTRCRKE